ncbi:MAG: hypothetical protein V4764_07865 [Burkholderia sp.]
MDERESLYVAGIELHDNGDFQAAFDKVEKAANLGLGDAQSFLANMYDAAEAGPRDREKAIFWYKKAIRNGLAYAASNLALLYKNEGKERWANFWLDRAVEMDDVTAHEELAAWWESSRKPDPQI